MFAAMLLVVVTTVFLSIFVNIDFRSRSLAPSSIRVSLKNLDSPNISQLHMNMDFADGAVSTPHLRSISFNCAQCSQLQHIAVAFSYSASMLAVLGRMSCCVRAISNSEISAGR